MKKLFTSLAAIIIVAMTIIMLMGCDKENKQSSSQIPTVSTTDVTTETSVTTSTIKYTTTTTDTTSSTSTTSTTTTATTIATTEYTEEETALVEEYQTYTETVAIPDTEEETQSNMTINYSINELTYYSGPIGCYGRWG